MPISWNRYSTRNRARAGWVFLTTCAVLLAACSADSVVEAREDALSQSLSANVGQEVDITLGNVGPATYASPPLISSNVLTFIGVDVVPPYTPAGPNRRFRFTAVAKGEAVVEFRRMLGDSLVSTVEDTIRIN